MGLGLAAAAGVCGTVGILGLYRGLAVGRMGVVAPVTAVVGASIPVAVGIVLQGLPAPAVVTGIGLGIVAVILVSASPGGPDAGRSGIEHALVAGLGIGAFNVLVSRLPEGEVVWPLVGLRLTALAILVVVVVVGRRAWRLPRPAAARASLVGVFDMAGNLFFIVAAQTGALAIAAILSSLYPVVTVILAIGILRERLTWTHALGVAAAATAIILIAGG